jgi:hypothetical protein
MKCDSRASLLACTFASPCFGHEPKVKVVTNHENIENMACTTEVDSKQCLHIMWAHMQINVGKMNKVKSSHFNTFRKSYK